MKPRRAIQLVLVLSFVLSAGAGWALAASTTPGGVIHACASARGGSLRLSVTCHRHERPIAWNVQGVPGAPGVNGANGANGTNGAPGAPGTARAYGLVAGNGTLTRSRNATVSHPSVGTYCITPAAGIDPATTGVLATPDFSADTTHGGLPPDQSAHVEFASSPSGCPAGALSVLTFRINNANAAGDHYDVEPADEAFFFVVP
jgi:hypothetical protein